VQRSVNPYPARVSPEEIPLASLVPLSSSQPVPKAVRDSSRLAQHGLALPQSTLRAVRKRGIYCQTALTLEFQHQSRLYVLRGTESGGAVADMGRYCAYVNAVGEPLAWLQPIDSLGVNGRHAVVIGPELVRIEMLRIGRTYELAITLHTLVVLPGSARPRMGSKLLFRGQQGTLSLELWKSQNKDLRGEISPVFYTSAGEMRALPAQFEEAVRKVSGGVCCVGCKRSHIATAPAPLSLVERNTAHRA
jgi:hypothetical protein